MLLLTACRRMAVADGRTPWGVLARAEGGGGEEAFRFGKVIHRCPLSFIPLLYILL